NLNITPGNEVEWTGGISVEGIEAGDHILFIRVRDSVGVWSIVYTKPFSIVGLSSVTNSPICQGSEDGIATVTIKGGKRPFTYLWDDPEQQSDSTATGLKAGTYTVTVLDSDGAVIKEQVEITEFDPIAIAITTSDTECKESKGSATAVATGQNPPFSYLWTSGSDKASATNLSSGIWEVTVTDNVGNSAYDEMILTVPAPESDPEEPEPEEPVTDSSAPQLTQFVLTPKVVNTDDRDQELNPMVHLTDDLKGVYGKGDQADPSYTGSSVMMRLRPEAGGDEKVDFILNRVSGDDLSGVYGARPIMPKGSKLGVWRVEYLYLVDRAGKYKYLSATEIDALLPGKQGTTIINKGHPKEGKPRIGPKTYVNGYRAKAISKKKVATASLSWKVKNNTRTAYVKLKIQKRVKSKLRVKRKARY
ncbi:hypothetical protein LCGC14_2767400, partial [marine sediment metagenome]